MQHRDEIVIKKVISDIENGRCLHYCERGLCSIT